MTTTAAPPLDGQCALVTGASKRIGAALAARLHAAGAAVGIHYRRSESDAATLCAKLNDHRANSAKIFQADLADIDATTALMAAFVEWAGGVDILVNNASDFYPTPIGTITGQDWDALLGSNLKGPLFLSQAAFRFLEQRRGTIINIIDIHAQRPLRNHSVYGASKAGLAMLTRSLAKDMAPSVRVNGVAPGAILWPESDLSDADKCVIVRQIPLARPGATDDIADCVLYLVGAPYVTGQIIAVDGGRSIGW